MVRWSLGPVLLLVMALLAGCLQGDPDPGPGDEDAPPSDGDGAPEEPSDGNDTQEPPSTPSTTFTATGCNAVVLLAIDDYDNIDDFLPAGFVPADVVSLLRLTEEDQAFLGQGAIGVVTASCEDNSITGAPFGLAFAGTLVYTPDIPQVSTSYVDGYQGLFAATDPQIAALFASYGWPAKAGLDLDMAVLLDQDVHEPVDVRVPGAAVAQVTGTIDGTQVFDGIALASATYHTSDQDEDLDEIRFWHDTPGGLSYFENVLDTNGKSGSADCTFAGEYAELIGRAQCDPGNTIGLIVADFGLETTLVLLDDVHA